MTARSRQALLWGVGPLLLALVAGTVGNRRPLKSDGQPLGAQATLTPAEMAQYEAQANASLSNAAWAFGDVASVTALSRREREGLGQGASEREARLLLRLALIAESPDAQASLFGSACAADADVCARLSAVAEEETQRRFVRPGNVVPLSLLGGGHPPIP